MSNIQKRLIPAYIFLIIMSFISVFPFYWMISAATNTTVEVARGKLTFGLYAWENLKSLMDQTDLWGAMKNSFVYATAQTIMALFICSLAGFGFELYHDKAKDRVFSILLLAMMIPGVATMIPLFKMISAANLLNSVWGFMLPAISTPFLIMMFRQNSRNFPVEIMEAARIDGSNEFRIFNEIVLPIMKPAIAVQMIFAFVASWNNYFIPALILDKADLKTVPIMVAQLRSADYSKFDMGKVYMFILLAILPVMLVYIILSKSIIKGVTSGSVKG